MKKLRMLWAILKRTHADKILFTFIINLFVVALLILLVEPDIHRYIDSLWYCYVSIATIGFGDIVAVTILGRLLTVYLSLHAILVIAIIPGVIVSYYTEVVNLRERETVTVFLDKLEHLPELSKEELQQLADKVKKFK
ncbi:potassium channel family protein [Anaerovorax odorimutans]|uniref:Potassium channel family protein n=1 Tax=Anaerovorax odorimutans TaxID=109327 RepID=A0ABT1RR27_9FIRM|nr:potassium channel family protein [Anaerovorax odorimutans]MCQ4637640.1 potassium channel family protein [Anaerovorax odorimutans]